MLNLLSRSPLPLASPLLVVALLGGLVIEKRVFHSSGADADAYHVAVRSAAADVPLDVGPWKGEDIEVTPAAIALLRPNFWINRDFRNAETHEAASVLLVHCRDARDLLGHFPPICYPAHGYTLESAEPRDWDVDGLAVHGTRYRFTKEELSLSSVLVVDNFMILPQGKIVRNMDEVDRVAQGIRARHFGAAQIQVLTQPGATPERRDAILAELVRPFLPVIRSIASGVEP